MPWLVVIGERDALDWILANRRMGFRARVKVGRVQAGDRFALYVTRSAFQNPNTGESQILAVGRFTTNPSRKPVRVAGEVFPVSCAIELVAPRPPQHGLPFRSLVEDLDFIKRPEVWGVYVRRTLVEISQDDFERIESALALFEREPHGD